MNALSAIPVDRRAERTHLFLVATLAFGRASTPVRVRNLSATGALIESADLPPKGTAIILRRGALEAVGSVIWSEPGKAGLAFSEPVAVSGWLPTKEAKRQTHIDQIAFEANQQARVAAPVMPPLVDEPLSMAAIAIDLAAVQEQLSQLGGSLALDLAMAAKHPVHLLDAAGHRLGRIVAALLAGKG